jgi:lipooligosaccharide transport system permease protein
MTLAILEYHWVAYLRVWRSSVVSSFVLPLLTMLGFGVGVGAYVTGGVEGAPYLDWMVPGLIASTAVQVAIGDATWPVVASFDWNKRYFAQAAAPPRVRDILDGNLLFVVVRVLLTAGAFLAIAAAFGTLHSWLALTTVPVAALVGLAVATPSFAYAASISSDSYLAILFRVGMIPMTLFSGVFFPVESLPAALEWIAYAFPLWHAVDLSRAATLGVAPAWPAVLHVLYLALWAAVGRWLALRRFTRRLVV